MKSNKLLIIALILFTLICLPISFASDCNMDSVGDSNLDSESINQIDSNVYLENNFNQGNDLNLDKSTVDTVNSDDSIVDSSSLGESIVDTVNSEDSTVDNSNSNSNENIENINSNSNDDLGSNDEESNLEGGNTIDYNSPNLDTNFTNLNVTFTNTNTIFVNASYTGTTQSGTIENPFKTLNAAFNQFTNASNTKTNIFLANGVYQITKTMTINYNVNIVGESTSNTIISGANTYQIFKISPPQIYGAVSPFVNIFNLTLTMGLSYYGGAIYINESGANFVNVNFINNTARNATPSYYSSTIYPGSGGAIYIDKAFVKFYNAAFIDNKALSTEDAYAGALINDMGETTIINSRFINNYVDAECGSGGAIYDYSGILVLFNSSIINNTVNSDVAIGGAIANIASHNIYILNSSLDGNRLYGNYTFGSAIINKANNLIISNTTISNNLANGTSDSNGTFFNLNGFVNISNLQFENNIAKDPQDTLFMCLEDQLIIERPFDDATLTNLPSSYDLRDYGWVTSVKDQGGSGSCWAFTSLAALESYLLKYENITYDFSENNMKNLMGYYGLNGTDWADGGNHYMALAYLLRWSGPVNESQDPFDDSSHSSKSNLNLTKHVQDVLYIPVRLNFMDINQIKAALMTYGALYTSMHADNSFQYAPDYYLDVISVSNHAVTIIGWDDNYSADNFDVKPPGDGAFIIKNSWGTDYGYDGYWYISYYDKAFAGYGLDVISAMAYTNVENVTNYKTNYQYDILGNTFESIGFGCSTAWFANQFVAKNNNPLSAFGIYTYGDSDYSVTITVNGVVKYIQDGIIKGAGYHTIKLDEFVELSKDDIFRVAVKLTTPISLFPVAIESQRSSYSSGAQAEEGQSFISPDGINWYDLATYNRVIKFYQYGYDCLLEEANVCLKAYASGYADIFLNVKSNASVYYRGDTVEITLTITNEGDYVEDINVSTLLESGVSVKSVIYYKGSFNYNTKVWHLDSLNQDESVVLKLKLGINKVKDVITTKFNFTYSGFVPSNLSSGVSLDLFYGGLTSIVQLENITTIARSQDEVLIKLVDWNSSPLANKNIVISLLSTDSGSTFTPVSLITDAEGYAKFTIDLLCGNYKFLASFNGGNNYDPSNMTFNVKVIKLASELKLLGDYDLSNISTLVYSNDEIKFYLIDEDSKIIKDKTIHLTFGLLNQDSTAVENQAYDLIANEDGYFKFNLNLSYGTYNFDLNFSNDDVYDDSSLSFIVDAFKKEAPIISMEKDLFNIYETLRVALKDSNGDALPLKVLKFLITDSEGNVNTFSPFTDNEGIVELNKLSLGTFNIKVIFEDDIYADSILDSNFSVIERKTQIIYSDMVTTAVDIDTDGRVGEYFNVVLKDVDGNPLVGKAVQIGFNGKAYDRITDENGSCRLQINLQRASIYTFAVCFLGDDENIGSFVVAKITVNPQKGSLEVPNKSYSASAKTKSLTATFKSASGKVVANKKVTFTVNGKTYTATTNDKGIATVNVSLNKKGTYSFTAKFDGDGTYSSISKTAKLTLK